MAPSRPKVPPLTAPQAIEVTQVRPTNSLVAINRLPLEILGHIFLLVDEHSVDDRVQTYLICDIILVCRLWNEVARETPYLWMTVSVYMSEQMYLRSLKLSKGCLLLVDCDLRKRSNYESHPSIPHIETFITRVGQHAARWKEAQLSNVANASSSLRNQTFSAMRKLSLTPSPDTSSDVAVFGSFRAPLLDELTIKDIPIAWTCSLFVGLTRLEIKGLRMPPSIAEFAKNLDRCPNLQAIELFEIYCRDLNDLIDSRSKHTISMPRLRNISLQVHSNYAVAFLTLIDAPNLAYLQVDVFVQEPSGVEQEQLVDIVVPFLSNSVSLRFGNLGSAGHIDINSNGLKVILHGLRPRLAFRYLVESLKRARLIHTDSAIVVAIPTSIHPPYLDTVYNVHSSLPLVRSMEFPNVFKVYAFLRHLAGVPDLENRFCDLEKIVVMNRVFSSPNSSVLQNIETILNAEGVIIRRLFQRRSIVLELRGFEGPDEHIAQELGRIFGVEVVRSVE